MENLIITKSPEETITAGFKYASGIALGDIIGLKGNLGSGKTQFVKGVCKYFQVSEIVNSPTFLIVNEYKGIEPVSKNPIHIHHFDLYRISSKEELETIGFEEYITKNSICIIEWCGIAEEFELKNMKKVYFDYGSSENERIIQL